ncbi:helix-turn-helix domain-containing protein [Pseudacidovorax sp. RU35E]|uniref:helix-turn-helix domain-containing protein n=1 Tax=Pseudacidovorax sp. RU35E TaxID=1907403 RepID=UPI00095438F7|nr:helix-turn-helix transcriptional regulator [Pseudacidovorax sp. RU35E]SIQ84690.1 Transcriptional regulator, contains XRE-family HTH domain [Pseudacidovorax sp. RU35E]
MSATTTPAAGAPPAGDASFGAHLRHWRQHRRLSQLELAHEADVSTRHLSCVETGRALPSRDMVLRLAERLAVPLRERNRLLVAAGYAPMYRERSIDDPALSMARRAVDRLLQAHEPYPALAIDRHWGMVAANALVPRLLEGVAASLLTPPVNVLRLSLHPEGLAPRIVNLRAWRMHLLERLAHQIGATADPALQALHQELSGYAVPPEPDTEAGMAAGQSDALAGIAVPLRLRMGDDTVLSLISTTTVFGTPVDITLQDLAIEAFFPADAATAAALAALAPAAERAVQVGMR